MKIYPELTARQAQFAVNALLDALVQKIVRGQVRFQDEQNGNNLQELIDKARSRALLMSTSVDKSPDQLKFAQQLCESSEIMGMLSGVARNMALMAFYPEQEDNLVRVPPDEVLAAADHHPVPSG